MLSLEELVQELINDGKGDIGRLEHILSTLKKGHSLYVSDQDYLEKVLAESRKNNDVIQSKEEPKVTESYSDNNNQSKDTTIQPTEIELLRKEIHKLQDRNHLIEEHLKNQPNKKIQKGRAIGGVILMAIGIVMVVGGGAVVIASLCIGQSSGYGGTCQSNIMAFIGGAVWFWIGMIPTVFGVRLIAKA